MGGRPPCPCRRGRRGTRRRSAASRCCGPMYAMGGARLGFSGIGLSRTASRAERAASTVGCTPRSASISAAASSSRGSRSMRRGAQHHSRLLAEVEKIAGTSAMRDGVAAIAPSIAATFALSVRNCSAITARGTPPRSLRTRCAHSRDGSPRLCVLFSAIRSATCSGSRLATTARCHPSDSVRPMRCLEPAGALSGEVSSAAGTPSFARSLAPADVGKLGSPGLALTSEPAPHVKPFPVQLERFSPLGPWIPISRKATRLGIILFG